MNKNNVPAGFVLVPIEPTWEMVCATPDGSTTVRDIYAAMIAAAPVAQPPASRELGPYFEEQPDGTLLPIGPDEYDTTQPPAPLQQTEAVAQAAAGEAP